MKGKMSISQLYQYLQTTSFFTRGTTTNRKNEILRQNPIITFASKAETQEYLTCMSLPANVLNDANHKWALELSYLVKCRALQTAITWLAGELTSGYTRLLKYKVQGALPWIIEHVEDYQGVSLREAIEHAYVETMQNNVRREQLRALMEAEAARAQGEDFMNLPIPPPPIHPERLAAMHAAHAQANACFKISVSFPTPQGLARSPGEGVPKTLFLSMDRLPEFRALFTQTAAEEEAACNICMTEKAGYNCGNGCSIEMCNNCFHEWFSKNPKCPACARDYIPLPLRNARTG
jgi:hypothetical protein